MEICLPQNNKASQRVSKFLNTKFSDEEYLKILERLEICEKLSSLALIKTHKLEKIEGSLYELRVPVAKANLRFFGILNKEKLTLIHAFKKKSWKIPRKELRVAKSLYRASN